MAKRIADKELTDRNWDQEEDTEEAGTFLVASDDVMKSRPIKKAKRRAAGAESENTGAFKGFQGFALSASGPAAAAPSFSGFGNGASFKPLASLTNGSSGGAAPVATAAFGSFSSPGTTKPSTTPGSLTFNGPSSAAPPLAVGGERQWNGSASGPTVAAVSVGSGSGSGGSSTNSGATNSSSTEYRRQLTALNCSVRDWITKHVNDNPLCDLNPIFRDYERHLGSIEKKYGGAGAGGAGATATGPPAPDAKSDAEGVKAGGLQLASSRTSTATSSGSSGGTAAPSLFSFSKDTSTSSTSTSVASGVTFNFGQKVDSSVLSSLGSGGAPSFSFSTSLSSSSASTPSLFGGQSLSTTTTAAAGAAAPSTPFSFSMAKAEAPSTDVGTGQNGADEESDEPPVPVVKEIKEKDAFYSKKCKLFYKKESEFKEKGVGTLHLKTVAEGKLQLLVRADTNLGNILLNIMVSPTMPCSRTGKNNVMVVCVPNPPVDDKNPTTPVPMLIRIKTGEDADELHKLMLEKRA
ncbi:nuclear pore complex protein Nup50 [Clupea harengus]|uniref:Nuclear pore complex protein Nup50 n=1 Tax=Clupea harengus TaxID=7950 RepID=A0A6P3WF18_CLUHA|nr:nuclear pore complex protein Nup50 [Clupea harengus]XP_012696843.2 nuclear pore complex protein Nup50 [Clupea harengus]XP_042566064.1 nuclear pore complex protein Nup50 [Clupea harengus]